MRGAPWRTRAAPMHRDRGDQRPHRLIARAAQDLKPHQRREGEGGPRRRAEGAHVRAALRRRRPVGDDGQHGRHPQHLAEHEHDHRRDDDRQRVRRRRTPGTAGPSASSRRPCAWRARSARRGVGDAQLQQRHQQRVHDRDRAPQRAVRRRGAATIEIGSSSSKPT